MYLKIFENIDEHMKNMTFEGSVGVFDSTNVEMQNTEISNIFKAILTAIFLVFLVMAMQFESPRFSLMVMTTIPFALIGSFLLLRVTNSSISMISMMGFLMLMGIVVNNGILYVDTANMLKADMQVEEALVESGCIRLRPILMTTLTTILSMVPMSLGLGKNGVIMQGMALVIIGGLIASTILSLILIPSFYLMLDKDYNKDDKNITDRHKTIKKVTEDLHRNNFNTAVAALMEFVNALYKNGANAEDLKVLAKLLKPFAPHLASEMLEKLKSDDLWPQFDEKYLHASEVEVVVQINGKLRAKIMVSVEEANDKDKLEAVAKADAKIKEYLKSGEVLKTIVIPKNHLVNIVVK